MSSAVYVIFFPFFGGGVKKSKLNKLLLCVWIIILKNDGTYSKHFYLMLIIACTLYSLAYFFFKKNSCLIRRFKKKNQYIEHDQIYGFFFVKHIWFEHILLHKYKRRHAALCNAFIERYPLTCTYTSIQLIICFGVFSGNLMQLNCIKKPKLAKNNRPIVIALHASTIRFSFQLCACFELFKKKQQLFE